MRRENRGYLEPANELPDPIGSPAPLQQPIDGILGGSLRRIVRRLLGAFDLTDRVAFFGQVHQLEVEAKGSCERLCLADLHFVEFGRHGIACDAVGLFAKRDRAVAPFLHEIEQTRAALFGDHLPEQGPE